MFEVIRNEYGKELGRFEFDYLGEHAQLDAIIIHAAVKLFEQGFHISSGLNSRYVFLRWGDITGITCTKEKHATIEVTSSEGVIKLQKTKQETDLNKLKQLLRTTIPDVPIEEIPARPDVVIPLGLARHAKRYDEQERRIQEFILKNGTTDERELLNAWKQHLIDTLPMPFEAEVTEGSSYLREGDVVRVIGLDDADDLYGILACLKKGRKKYWYPLCNLEATDTESDRLQHMEDYSVWFCNW